MAGEIKASEWWCLRLAYMIGEANLRKNPEDKEIYRRYACIARTEMEICGALELAWDNKRA